MRAEQLTRFPSLPWIQASIARVSDSPWHGTASWGLRLTATGTSVLFFLGVTAQIAIVRWGIPALGVTHPLSWSYRLASTLVSSLVIALLVSFASAWTATLTHRRAGRRLALLLPTALLTLWFIAFELFIAGRILSGTHVSWGALQFLLGAPGHFLHAAVDEYLDWTLTASVIAALFAVFVWRLLAKQLTRPGSGSFPILALASVTMLLQPSLIPHRADQGANAQPPATPTQSLARSVVQTWGNTTTPLISSGANSITPKPGPSRQAGVLWQVAVKAHKKPRPNILLLMMESVSASHMGYEGYDRPVTPNIDKLASESLRAHRVWTTATHSNYAQMAILSSLFPRRHTQLDMYWRLDYPRELLHDMFHELGYATASITSQDETWQGMLRFQHTDTPHMFWNALSYHGKHLDIGTERTVPDAVTTARAIQWIDKHRDKPWSLYVNLQSTHFPYAIPENAPHSFKPDDTGNETFTYLWYPKKLRPVALNRYDNALAYVDRQVGRLRAYLAETGQLDNTLWIVTADHGEMFYDHGLVTHGRTLYDAESRVPLLMHWPAKIKPHDVWRPSSHLDILPTVSHAIGLPPHPSYQGEDMTNEKPRTTGIFMNIQGLRFVDGLVCYPWKYIYDRTAKTSLLFNLQADPRELHNVVDEQPTVAGALASALQAQIRAQIAYHEDDDEARKTRYQPRLLSCPDLSVPSTQPADP